jgi:phage FluMu protein gp41
MTNTVIKKLPAPFWMLAGAAATEIEVRESTMEDLLEAEKEAHPHMNPHAFRIALATRQLVRAGTYTGPFSVGLFKKMKPRVWAVIAEALEEVDQLGEDGQPSQAQPS